MSGVGGVSSAVALDASQPVNQSASSKSVDGSHSMFGKVSISAKPGDSDSLEELSSAISSLKKFESKDEVKGKDLRKELERLKEAVPDMPGMEKMDKFLQQLQSAKKQGQLTQGQIKQFSQEYSGDPSLQNMAMEALIEHLQAEDAELANLLQDYNQEFYESDRVDIQSGKNITLEVYELAKKAGMSPQECRDDCRNNLMRVPDIETLLDGYNYIMDKAGGNPELIPEKIDIWMKELSTELVKLEQGKPTALDANGLLFVRINMEKAFAVSTMRDFSNQNEGAANRMLINARR